MHCRTRAVFLLMAAVAVVGCTGTDSSGTRNMVPTGPSLFASPYPDIDAQIIALFPSGGGGYVVASRLLSPAAAELLRQIVTDIRQLAPPEV